MSNNLYSKAREKFAQAALNWNTSDIKVALIDTAFYTVDIDNHEFFSSVPVGARTAVSGSLTGKTSVGGACDADNVTLPLVTGPQSEAIIVYKDTGNEATSPLIAYIDTSSGLPITPNGSDQIITWDNGANKIFRI